jgi:hypothetical protein
VYAVTRLKPVRSRFFGVSSSVLHQGTRASELSIACDFPAMRFSTFLGRE